MARRKKIVIPDGTHPIKKFRLIRDFTLGELSSLLDMTVQHLDDIEKEKIKPTPKEKYLILIMTGIRLSGELEINSYSY
ncbi:helix-turn-helix domain-containing protein [Pectinatus sottacetonis]|uniref:helix-turn-helix domain-containing protein n=1 Tax=Pectinatus sottacetonis TaxID=1002795 RepID=UPI0018C5421F|nr:helix-turn-helix transcriptional regulator [Pectinatus sottacetonis]